MLRYCPGVLLLMALTCCDNEHVNSNAVIIGLQPIKGFDKVLVDTLARVIARNYNCKVYSLPMISMPSQFRVHYKTPRLRADSIIRYLRETNADSINIVVALTTEDISTTKKVNGHVKEPRSKYLDWGVFGLGYQPGESCVISTFRIRSNDRKRTMERLKKVSLHEVGHNFGLEHCSNKSCFMRDAEESIKSIDEATLFLCDHCKSKL